MGREETDSPKTPFWTTVSPHDAFSAPLARSDLWGIAQLSRDTLQNGVSDRCACVKRSANGGYRAILGGVLKYRKKCRAACDRHSSTSRSTFSSSSWHLLLHCQGQHQAGEDQTPQLSQTTATRTTIGIGATCYRTEKAQIPKSVGESAGKSSRKKGVAGGTAGSSAVSLFLA